MIHLEESIEELRVNRDLGRILSVVFLCAVPVIAQTAQKPLVEFKNSPDISAPAGYSHVVVVNRGRTVFLSGQVGLNKQGAMVGKDDFRAQAEQAFANLRSALAAIGASPASIVKLNYFVVGLNHEKLLALREARDQFIDKDHPPASTLAGVQALFREDAMVEIDAVAVVP
jgi:enamine deaminase RidA (YjgF/YER057c/UK114 family)